MENIGARRLQTVMERVLDEISFAAPDRHGETITVDADYVHKHVGDLAKNADLSRFILWPAVARKKPTEPAPNVAPKASRWP